MRALFQVSRFFLSGQRTALLRGWALSLTVLLAGAALLGLSGWFITAAALAGLVGIGVDFDVFRPSAGVRFLALGRTAARYGERLLTHDATLRALAELRVRLLAHRVAMDFEPMQRLRGALALNRLTADVDALDGVPLRLIIPLTAGVAALGVSFVMLWWLVDLRVAAWVAGGFIAGAVLVLVPAARTAVSPSRMAEQAMQALRARLIDLLRARQDLTVYGQLGPQIDAVLAAEQRARGARQDLDRIERRAGLILSIVTNIVAAGALGLGGMIALQGTMPAALAALGFFAALGLIETIAPLRRAVAELGRMTDAARRVAPELGPLPAALVRARLEKVANAPVLAFRDVGYRHPGASLPLLENVSFDVEPGQAVALRGKSGRGKSTLLQIAAGLVPPSSGRVDVFGQDIALWPEGELRGVLGMLPQRSALMSGTILEALNLGVADTGRGVSTAEAWAVLEAVCLADVVRARGGLDLRLGERGAGLSGGESRRLALARVLLRSPGVLLLDEVTEGLDETVARGLLSGLRAWSPDTAILLASHRDVELQFAGQIVTLD